MTFHHTAFATRDLASTHRFYTEAMGFDLIKVVVAPTEAGGWAKHAFYEIEGSDTYVAFWDLHDDTLKDFSPAISTGMGLPIWVNHLAFKAKNLDDIQRRLHRWLDYGVDAMEIDHGWCTSIYCVDPNGILVEFCTTTAALGQKDREEALRLLADPAPALETPPQVVMHKPRRQAVAG